MKVGDKFALRGKSWEVSGVYLTAYGQDIVGLKVTEPTFACWGHPVEEMTVPKELIEYVLEVVGPKAKPPETPDKPVCYGVYRSSQQDAEADCTACPWDQECFAAGKARRKAYNTPFIYPRYFLGVDAGGRDQSALFVAHRQGGKSSAWDILRRFVTEQSAVSSFTAGLDAADKVKKRMKASDILRNAAEHMEDRAKFYDKPKGERSMPPTVAAFNAITGHKLTEEQGWLFMELLKCVRSEHNGYRRDNYEDGAAYAALKGEAAARNRGENDPA